MQAYIPIEIKPFILYLNIDEPHACLIRALLVD
jgi:hypothetical protein